MTLSCCRLIEILLPQNSQHFGGKSIPIQFLRLYCALSSRWLWGFLFFKAVVVFLILRLLLYFGFRLRFCSWWFRLVFGTRRSTFCSWCWPRLLWIIWKSCVINFMSFLHMLSIFFFGLKVFLEFPQLFFNKGMIILNRPPEKSCWMKCDALWCPLSSQSSLWAWRRDLRSLCYQL